MKYSAAAFAFLFLVSILPAFKNAQVPDSPVYEVTRLKRPMKIDADWKKRAWRNAKEITITRYMGDVPAFKPVAKAKMMYDAENVYIIFKVDDNFVRLAAKQFNDRVYEDACVEFFFAPDSTKPLSYFNLEMNGGGIALMEYHEGTKSTRLTADEFAPVEIAHTLPKTLDKEITEPVTWTVEYKLPLSILKKYSNVTQPQAGTHWKANFFKTSSRNSNPHYITWSFVNNKTPRFHMPEYFGGLTFK